MRPPVPGPHATLRAELLGWYDAQKRDLPFRRTRDPYAIWVSEVMLQQTQVAVVLPYWTRFLARFPDVPALAAAPLGDVLALWRGLGYYARARHLHRAARVLVERFGGSLPDDPAALATLPGFGRYTVGAVASIAFGQQLPLVDGNVARVLCRLFAIPGSPGEPSRERRLWELARTLVPADRPGDWNQALMELGATLCKPDAPLCLLCPVRGECRALREGRSAELPPPRRRAVRRAIRLAVAVVRRGERMLLGRRPEAGLFGGLWELPSVEVSIDADGSSVRAALEERLGRLEGRCRRLVRVERTLTHRELTLDLWAVRLGGEPLQGEYEELRWAIRSEASALGMSSAMAAALAALEPHSEGAGELRAG